MKAIQVLKNCLKYSDYGNDIEEKEYIRKAIAELEVIQDIILEKDEALDIERLLFKNKFKELNNRSCMNCICWDSVDNSKLKTISYCRFLNAGTKNIFYCNEYEPKQ